MLLKDIYFVMEKIMTNNNISTTYKVVWVIFVGLWGSIFSALVGAVCCLTIVGIPFGIKHFKFIKLLFFPSNVAVATRIRHKHLALNLGWAVFGGLLVRYLSAFWESIFALLGIKSFANNLHNVRDYLVSPYDSELVEIGKYSSTGDTRYDYNLLQRKIIKNPNQLIMDEKKGRVITIKKHLKQYDNEVASVTRTSSITIFLALAVMAFGIASLFTSPFIGVPIVLVTFVICVVMNDFQSNHLLSFYDKNIKRLMTLYNEDAPFDLDRPRLSLSYMFKYLAEERAKHKKTIIKNSATRSTTSAKPKHK